MKGFVIRDEPQSDSEVSDVSLQDSEDEYIPTQHDNEVLKQDLMLDFEGNFLSLCFCDIF